jgi:hypothetical protein
MVEEESKVVVERFILGFIGFDWEQNTPTASWLGTYSE